MSTDMDDAKKLERLLALESERNRIEEKLGVRVPVGALAGQVGIQVHYRERAEAELARLKAYRAGGIANTLRGALDDIRSECICRTAAPGYHDDYGFILDAIAGVSPAVEADAEPDSTLDPSRDPDDGVPRVNRGAAEYQEGLEKKMRGFGVWRDESGKLWRVASETKVLLGRWEKVANAPLADPKHWALPRWPMDSEATQWTKTPPTEPGLYWIRNGDQHRVTRVFLQDKVQFLPGGRQQCIVAECPEAPFGVAHPPTMGCWWWPVPLEHPA